MGETAPFDDNGHHHPGESLVGRTIAGKFVLEAALGAGAMGVVYRARQTTLDKVVAIKVMHAGIASDKTYVARFQLEARAASRLDHPNSVHMLDFGQEPDGLLYIAMEYLGGRDLLDVVNEEWPLSTKRIVDILSQALSALAVAHEMGVLHRDLKPENLMILRATGDDGTPTDNIKVCDFGIAKLSDPSGALGEMPKLTTGHLVVGTPAYMAPEQAHGEPIDGRVDVYSIGVILYQLLTHRVPFEGSTPLATVLKLTQEEAVPPSALVPSVDRELEAICLKAISKKPSNRFASAREMRAALRAVLKIDGSGARAVQPKRVSAPDVPALPAPRERPRLAWALGGAAAVVGFYAAFFVDKLHHESQPPPTAVVTSEPTAAVEERRNDVPAATAPTGALAPAESPSTSASSAKTRKTKSPAEKIDPPTHEPAAAPSAASAPSSPPAEPSAAVVPTPAPPPPTSPPVEAVASNSVRAPTAAPREAPRATPPAPSARPIDPNLMRVDIGSATEFMGTTTASINKVLVPLASRLTACYRAALPQVVEGTFNLHIETDLDGVITAARLPSTLPSTLTSCIVNAVRGRKIPNVDTGIATADVPLSFKSR